MSVARPVWSGLLVASAALAGAVEVAGGQSPLRVAVVLWFVLFCPGMAVVRLLGLHDAAVELALAVAVSVALAVAAGGIALYSGLWSPRATLAILILITIGGAAAPLVRSLPGRSRP
jgi:hypothetical protein